MNPDDHIAEWVTCEMDVEYFVERYCADYDMALKQTMAVALHGIIFRSDYLVESVMPQRKGASWLSQLREMHGQLPDWMKGSDVVIDEPYHWQLSNGSGVQIVIYNS